MTTLAQIKQHLAALPEPKQADVRALHALIRKAAPKARLWFSDGKDERGRVVTNPTIGYGLLSKSLADGKVRASFRIGLSANATGISMYILGLDDKTLLARTYGKTIGKATISGGGYCIRFKSLKEIDTEVLLAAVRHGLA